MRTFQLLILFFLVCHVSSGKTASSALEQDSRIQEIAQDMVFVKGGCFHMGNVFTEEFPREKPVHEVCLDDYYLGKHEVTVREFKQFVERTGYMTEAEQQDGCHSWEGNGESKKMEFNWRNAGFLQTRNDPVVCVSWNDAGQYIRWLNEKSGKDYRLPTEAEWEYAARSRGKDFQFSWGKGEPSDNIADKTARKELLGEISGQEYDDGYVFTSPVGSFRANEEGLYDMSGNVYEWVSDWADSEYYRVSPKYNPAGPEEGKAKVMRGGSWNPLPELVWTTTRRWNVPGARGAWIGFRLAHPGNLFRAKKMQ